MRRQTSSGCSPRRCWHADAASSVRPRLCTGRTCPSSSTTPHSSSRPGSASPPAPPEGVRPGPSPTPTRASSRPGAVPDSPAKSASCSSFALPDVLCEAGRRTSGLRCGLSCRAARERRAADSGRRPDRDDHVRRGRARSRGGGGAGESLVAGLVAFADAEMGTFPRAVAPGWPRDATTCAVVYRASSDLRTALP